MTAQPSPHQDHALQPHPKQPDLEDQPFDHYQLLAEAVGELLIEKGVFGAADLRRTIEAIDARSPADGARLVARAWLDPAFKARLLADVNAAALEFGIDAGAIPIRALENTPELHNVVICTLCSCYPRGLLGLPPDWYKARAYRSRAIREPRAVLAEFGTRIPDEVVVPMRPPGTEGLDEAALAGLVTRDCMIGTAVPEAPRP
jgi:nitrile hydratase